MTKEHANNHLYKDAFIKYVLTYNPDSKRISLDLNKELSLLNVRAEDVNRFIENLIAQHAKGLIPQSTLASLLEKHKREKSAIDIEIKKIRSGDK